MTVTAQPIPYQKGFFGTQYRTLIGLHRNVGANSSAAKPGDPAWDVWIADLPFLLASAEGREYIRESTSQTRERFDNARDPGENSLDSSLWLRSWTSWHLGAGQDHAEPLETAPDVARFRFSRSAGVDVWTLGQMSLLHRMVQQRAGEVKAVLGVPGVGLLEARTTGVWLNGVKIGTTPVTKIAAGGNYWAGVSSTGTLVYGKYDGSGTGTVAGLSNVSLVAYQKNRFWAVDGPNSLREIPSLTGTLPAPILFLDASKIIDIDSGVAGVYVMTNEGMTNIHVIGAEADGSLAAPVNVATLPRGETGSLLYGYLGRYLLIGSSRGVRVADTGQQTALIGPLVIEMPSAPADFTADGNYAWVTGHSADFTVDPDEATVARPGTYRLDLSRVVESSQTYGETAASRFPCATDQFVTTETERPVSLSTYNGLLYLALEDGQLWVTDPGLMEIGWLETGSVTFSTGEFKAWQSVRAEVFGEGWFGAYANSGFGWSHVIQNPLPAPLGLSVDIDTRIHPPSGALNLRFLLRGNATGTITPILKSAGLRSLAAAKRTRRVRLPLMAFDREVDRNQTPIGYEGFAFDRVKDLEALEKAGNLLQVLDTRTGETLSGQIEQVTFQSVTPPDRGLANWGGFCQITLLIT